MNIVLDAGLELDNGYREALSPILPLGQNPLKLDSFTEKTDGTPNINEGFVFITSFPTDIMRHHTEFFKNYNKAPQWFLILINKTGHGSYELNNVPRRFELKNCVISHADSLESFAKEIEKISKSKRITKGKTLLLTMHNKKWVTDLADLLFDSDKNKCEIKLITPNEKVETDAQICLLCGEKINNFTRIPFYDNVEPYFVFRFKNGLQHYINRKDFVNELAAAYNMTFERAESRLYFVDVEGEKWLSAQSKSIATDAVKEDIFLWDNFGLPLSRNEYTEENIIKSLKKSHESFESLKENVLSF